MKRAVIIISLFFLSGLVNKSQTLYRKQTEPSNKKDEPRQTKETKIYDNSGSSSTIHEINYNESSISGGIGLLLGFHKTFKDKILIDMYAGPAYAIQFTRSKDVLPSSGYYYYSSGSRGGVEDPLVK